jgi:hypothetical protein
MLNRNTISIIYCLEKDLVWINNDDQNQMIKNFLSTPKFQSTLEFARKNQLNKEDGIISIHYGGTMSFLLYRVRKIRIFILFFWFKIMN